MADRINSIPTDFQKWRVMRIHPCWFTFIKYCEDLKYGEIDKLKIQDGLPLLAEETKKKVKFSGGDIENNSRST
ncbi:MAG: hypothetical protein GTO17_08010 [Candidatus Aminicenantes bacterium]|nr:hypothetical protein [Candidatus Aminicenantes bacterium]